MKRKAIYTVLAALALLSLLLSPDLRSAFSPEEAPGLELSAMEQLASDPTAPPVKFTIRYQAPADDFFAAREDGLARVRAWQIQVLDGSGREVGLMQGAGRPPAGGINWAGVSSEGAPLPDGFYSARLAWLDEEKRPHTASRVSLSLFTPLAVKRLAGQQMRIDYGDEGLIVAILESMIFKPGQSRIEPEALPALREMTLLLKAYPKKRAVVRGYTDSTGSPQGNLALSRQRAERVYDYLVMEGINPARLKYSGLGSAHPVASNDTAEGRARNRRIEVVVLKKSV
jgi:outer membrane protein OmpA-like peptidoglycan-associated protein